MKNILVCTPLYIALSVFAVFSQTTEFTYQGNLNTSGSPANGNYDFEFALYDAPVGGTLLTTPLARNSVTVSNGLFAVKLDFGNQFPGANRFLEIRVRLTGQPTFTVLAPRQQLSSSPYAVKSLSAENAINAANAANATNAVNAANATNATTATNALNLGGVAAGQYVLTGDPRLSDARPPVAGSANYIQNQVVSPQAVTNFNISGVGKAGSFDASGSFYIGGVRNLSMAGTGNLFVGANSGIANTTGHDNTFAGQVAGYRNTTGSNNAFFGFSAGYENWAGSGNSFFGWSAGAANTIGNGNSFFGNYSGLSNITGISNSFFGGRAGLDNTEGMANSFFGTQAGWDNTTGNYNTIVGYSAGYYNTTGDNNSFFGTTSGQSNTTECCNTFIGDLSNGFPGVNRSTAIGHLAQVTQSNSLVLGSIDGVNGSTVNTSVGIGTTAPSNRLQVVASLNAVATPTGHVALIENSNTGTSPDVLALKIGRATNPEDANNFITFFKGDNMSAGSIQGNAAGGVMLGGPGSDYAEWLPRLDPNERIEPGDVVGVFAGKLSRTTTGATLVMALSTGAIVAGNDPGERRRESHSLVAFMGQAMVKVIGPVRAGDVIIPSGLDDGSGIAVSPENITAAQFGQAVGQAWEGSEDTGLKKVRVAVGLIRNDATVNRLFEQARRQEDKIQSLQHQINELKNLMCPANRRQEICKE